MAVVEGSASKWDTDSLVPETKMVDVGKLISFVNLLVRKVMWFMLTTTSATLIFIPRISHIYSRLAVTHLLLHFDFQRYLGFASQWHTAQYTQHGRVYTLRFFSFLFCLFGWTCSSLAHSFRHFIKSWKRQTTNMRENTSSSNTFIVYRTLFILSLSP